MRRKKTYLIWQNVGLFWRRGGVIANTTFLHLSGQKDIPSPSLILSLTNKLLEFLPIKVEIQKCHPGKKSIFWKFECMWEFQARSRIAGFGTLVAGFRAQGSSEAQIGWGWAHWFVSCFRGVFRISSRGWQSNFQGVAKKLRATPLGVWHFIHML